MEEIASKHVLCQKIIFLTRIIERSSVIRKRHLDLDKVRISLVDKLLRLHDMTLVLPGESNHEEAPEGQTYLMAPPGRLKILLNSRTLPDLFQYLIASRLKAKSDHKAARFFHDLECLLL